METVTLFVCNCCGKPAHAVAQPILVPGRDPLIQVECLQPGCHNNYWTYTYSPRPDDDNTQLLERYTPVSMSKEQAARFVQANA